MALTTSDNLGCGFCCRPLDLCDCGVDYEMVYRPFCGEIKRDNSTGPGWDDMAACPAIAMTRSPVDSGVRGWVAMALGLGVLVVLYAIVTDWDAPAPNALHLAPGDVCSIDNGEHWFKARDDGMCYFADAPRLP